MARTKIVTAAALQQIRILIDQGVAAREIAHKVGCTLGTLRVVCSKSKISLRRKNPTQNGEQTVERVSTPRLISFSISGVSTTMGLRLPKQTAELLRQQAAAKGLSASTLATTLLKVIAQDDLWDAVLDEDEPSVRRVA